MADPIWFFCLLVSIISCTELFNTLFTIYNRKSLQEWIT